MTEIREIDEFKLTLYGFTGYKFIRIHQIRQSYHFDRDYDHQIFFSKVPDDFSLNKVKRCTLVYGDCSSTARFPISIGNAIGYNLEIEGSADLFEIRDKMMLPIQHADIYPIFDIIIKTRDKLGLKLHVNESRMIDDMKIIVTKICNDAVEINEILNFMKGKDVFSIASALNVTNRALCAETDKNKEKSAQIAQQHLEINALIKRNQELEIALRTAVSTL